jgi:hypothetical protein
MVQCAVPPGDASRSSSQSYTDLPPRSGYRNRNPSHLVVPRPPKGGYRGRPEIGWEVQIKAVRFSAFGSRGSSVPLRGSSVVSSSSNNGVAPFVSTSKRSRDYLGVPLRQPNWRRQALQLCDRSDHL